MALLEGLQQDKKYIVVGIQKWLRTIILRAKDIWQSFHLSNLLFSLVSTHSHLCLMEMPKPMGIPNSLKMEPLGMILHPWSMSHRGGGGFPEALIPVFSWLIWEPEAIQKIFRHFQKALMESSSLWRSPLVSSANCCRHIWETPSGRVIPLILPVYIFLSVSHPRASAEIVKSKGAKGNPCLTNLFRSKTSVKIDQRL